LLLPLPLLQKQPPLLQQPLQLLPYRQMQKQLPSCLQQVLALLLLLLLLCRLRLGLHQHRRPHHHLLLLLLLWWCPTWLVSPLCVAIPARLLRPTVLHATALAALLLKPHEATLKPTGAASPAKLTPAGTEEVRQVIARTAELKLSAAAAMPFQCIYTQPGL
jgi:hypothetical protein